MAKQMTKVYVLRSGTKSQYGVTYLGKLVKLIFTGGRRTGKFIPGRLVTDDPELQAAVESHPDYGAEFYLDHAKTAQANQPPVNNIGSVNPSAPSSTPRVEIEYEPSKKGVGAAGAKKEADIIAEGMASISKEELERINAPKEPEVEIEPVPVPPEDITTVAAASEWLREHFSEVKASEVNTRAGIKEVADSYGVVFEGMDL